MKKFLAIAFVAMMSLGTMAQTAQQVLNKTAAIVGNKKGASASFKLSSPKYGSTLSLKHLRAHETRHDLVCRLLLEKKKNNTNQRNS